MKKRLLFLGLAAGITLPALTGCAFHKSHKIHSYDQAMDEDRDPTFKADPERADEEVRPQ